MKKKVLLTLLLICALALALTVSALAASTNEFGTVEVVSGMSEKSVFGDDGKADSYTSRVVLFDGEEYHTYPAYYIFTNDVNTTTDFSQLNTLASKSYGKKSVIRAEVPENVQKVTGDVFNAYNDLKYVRFPDTLKEISGNMFYTSHGLEWVNVPRDCTIIQAYAFYGCAALKTIDMSNAQSLKKTEANQFYNCPKLEELIFPEGFEYFGGAGGGGSNYQNGLGSLKKLYLPDSVTYMGTIAEMKSIGTFTVPQGVTSLKDRQFSYCTGLNEIIIHKGVTSVSSNAFDMTFYLRNIVYTGESEDAVVLDLKQYSSPYVASATITYGNHCVYYYDGEHINDVNPCVLNCTRCNSVNVPKESPVHSEITTAIYEKGFGSKGVKAVTCTNEGCAYCVPTEMDALVWCKGYTVAEYGEGGFSIGYKINREAIGEYEEIMGEKVQYGIFFVLKDTLGENDIINSDGIAASDVIAADVTAGGFDLVGLKIVGFVTDEQKAEKFTMGAYVIASSKDEKKISYVQIDEPKDGEKYCFFAYNDYAPTEN